MSAGLKTTSHSPVLSQFQRARRSTIPVHQTTDNGSCSPSRRVSFPDPPHPHSETNAKGYADASTSFGCSLSAGRLGSFSSSARCMEWSVGLPPSPQRSQRSSTPCVVTSSSKCANETPKEKHIHRRKPDPSLVLAALDDLLPPGSSVPDFGQLMEEHKRDLEDIAKHESLKTRRPMNESGSIVFGISLRESSKYASASALFNGHELHLPIVVFSCVEELYRTGIYQPDLFRALPNRERLSELVHIFNSPDPHRNYRCNHRNRRSKAAERNSTLLHLESTQDICALLSDYLCSLPEPILPPYLFEAIWEGGELVKEAEDEQRTAFGGDAELFIKQDARRRGAPSLVRTYSDAAEATRIKIVQHLLCLLPSPNFSLLIYLLAFFSHVVMMQDVNGVCAQDLGRLFGKCVFGGRKQSQHLPGMDGGNVAAKQDGKTMMSWFLERWGPLADGMLDVIGAFSRGMNTGSPLDPSPFLPAGSPPSRKGVQDNVHIGFTAHQVAPNPLPIFFGPPGLATTPDGRKEEPGDMLKPPSPARKNNADTNQEKHASGSSIQVGPPVPELPSGGKGVTPVAMSATTSVSSAAAIDERLLDVAFPVLYEDLHFLDNIQSDSQIPAHAADTSSDGKDTEVQAATKELFQARAKIRNLERQIEKSDAMVAQVLEVMFRANRRIDDIDNQLEEMEIVLRCGIPHRQKSEKVRLSSDSHEEADILRERFDMAMMERMNAYEVVVGLRNLISGEL